MSPRSLKMHPKPRLMLGIYLILGLSACQNVPVTLNGNRLNSTPLLTGFRIEDKHLLACVNEHIFDHHISQAAQLTELNCAQRSIHSLNGLDFFPHLLILRLPHNPINSFKPLLALSNLEQLQLSEDATDCASLAQLRSRGIKVEGACTGTLAK